MNWRTPPAKIGFCGDKLSQERENVVKFPGFKGEKFVKLNPRDMPEMV